MTRQRLAAITVAAVALTLLALYFGLWVSVSPAHVGASDFTATYVGATLLREGHGAAIYDQSLQAPLYAALIAPARGGTLAFVYPPLAAVVTVPLTLLPLATAYRVFQVAQLLMLVAAVVIASRAAPWPGSMSRGAIPVVAGLAALAGTGTLALGLLGQWDGVGALGLAAGYVLWRRDAAFAGGAAIAVSAAVAKPHLALGVVALIAGWRDRCALAGALAGIAVTAAASLAAVGVDGPSGFLGAAAADAGRWPLASMLGFTGLTGSWLGNGAAPQAIAAAASLLALAACFVLGRRLSGDRSALEPCLAAAALLSLLASPHLLSHDLVLLAPVFVGLLSWAATRDAAVEWPGPASATVLGGWLLLALAAAVDLGSQEPAPPGRLVPWVLMALAGGLARQLWPPGRRALRPRQAS